MKKSKILALVAAGVLAAAMGLAGCGGGASNGGDQQAAEGEYTLLTEGTLTVVTSPDYPPFENMENGEFVGLDMDIARAVADKLGLQVEFKQLQFDELIPAIVAGETADISISGFTVDPDRAKEIDFTNIYYIDDQAIAAMNGGQITADNVDEMLATAGTRVAVQSGTSGEAYIQENYPNATVVAFGNSTDAFAAMQAGQADAVCTNKAVVEAMLASAYQDASVVKAIATGEEYAIVVSQDNPGLRDAINNALTELQAEGVIDQLVEQWLG